MPFKANVARFHIVIRGHAWLKVDQQNDLLDMANGDLIVITRGAGHDILNEPQTPTRPLSEVLSEVNFAGHGPLIYGGGGLGCTLVCGEFAFENEGPNPLLDNLPAVLHVPGDKGFNPTWLDSTLGFIAHEAATEQTGALAIVDRLAEIIFIQVVRAYVNTSGGRIPFLAALGDPQISRALGLIHAEPSFAWTVAELGQRVGMSRSAFSNRFSELVGMTPYQYVTSVRMQQAAKQLKVSDQTIQQVADSVGYESEAAFSSAFKQHFGARPGKYRRKGQASPMSAP